MTNQRELPARARAEEVAAMLKALSHPLRLVIAERLLAGECSVGELEVQLGIHQPNLSQYLGALREGGLVTPRREEKHIYYSLKEGRAADLVAFLTRPAHGQVLPVASESIQHVQSAEPARITLPAAELVGPALECIVFAVAASEADDSM